MSTKVSLAFPNIADVIHDRLTAEFGPLIDFIRDKGWENVWFTGSKVWTALYGMQPPADADLDIFVMREKDPPGSIFGRIASSRSDGHHKLLAELKRIQAIPPTGTRTKARTSLGGDRVYTSMGSIDIWTCPYFLPREQLEKYPEESHGQARAAYNPVTEELIVMRNPAARLQAKREIIQQSFDWQRITQKVAEDIAKEIDEGFVQAAMKSVQESKRWNDSCPACGKGIYRGFAHDEHEGGKCPKG